MKKKKNYLIKIFLSIKASKKAAPAKVEEKDHAPQIVDHVQSKSVTDGDAVTLSCRIIGANKFDVVWLHNNKEIKPSKDFQYSNEANIHKLVIAEIFPEDCGTYTCEAFNDAGESFSSCTLNVLGMFFFFKYYFDMKKKVGNRFIKNVYYCSSERGTKEPGVQDIPAVGDGN